MEKIKKKFKAQLAKRDCAVLKTVLIAAAAFLAAFGKILGFPSSMNVAVAALSGPNVIAAFLGSLASYIVSGSLESGIVQICSILVIAAVRAINPFGVHRDEPVYLSMLAAGTLMLFGCVMSVALPSDTYTASLRMISALMCGCVVFIGGSVAQTKRKSGVYDLAGVNGVFVSILYIMIISTLTSVPAYVLNIGRILGTSALLLAVRRYKNIGGAVVGALTTCGVLLCEPYLARNTLLLATSGLICGAFVQFGTLVTVLVFLVSSLLSLVAVGVNADTYHMFADLVAGTMLFVAVPVPAVKRFAKRIVGVKNAMDIVGQTTSCKLGFASGTLESIRQQLTMVTAAMDKRSSLHRVADDAKSRFCCQCDCYELCFGRHSRADIGLARLESIAEKYNSVSLPDVESCLKCCTCKERFCESFNKIYREYLSERAEYVRLREMREFLAEQLSSMEDMLKDLSFRTGQVRSIDPSLSAQVRDYFSNLGYPNAKVCVYVDENLCRRTDVFLTAEFSGDPVKVTAAVSSIVECDLNIPVIVREDRITRISFTEIPAYSAQTAVFTASASGEYSGDSYEIFDLNGSEKYILLSDGMGTGKRARLDSVFSVSLIAKLVRSGMSLSTAHKMINSMLRVKGWEESFATLDLLKIDLYCGSAQLLKAGAVQSHLCRDGSVTALGGQSFPAGILAECVPDVTDIKLFDGDILLLTTDGVDDDTAEDISHMVFEKNFPDLDAAVREMGTAVLSQRPEENRDDVTIIAVKIRRKR